MKSYEYDIAISLCNQDAAFAKRLISFLNPGLKIFFYENNQEILISQSGPQAFAGIFRDKSRVVVILSRDEWSNSFYTDIERSAIVDRTAIKNEGYHFLFVIPMEPNQVPPWYPSTRIYADPRRFSIEELAKFVEFKVTEQGGLVKPITLEERHDQFLKKIEEKKSLIHLQESNEAVDSGWQEMQLIRKLFDDKIESLKGITWASTSYNPFYGLKTDAYFGISNYQLYCKVPDFAPRQIRAATTQDYYVQFQLHQIVNNELSLLSESIRFFFFGFEQRGWAEPILYDVYGSHYEVQLLFRNRSKERYDLKNCQSSEELVDSWFQKLFKLATTGFDKLLK